ncbi:MAG: DinB family protein [Saprospiraceae bacterium]
MKVIIERLGNLINQISKYISETSKENFSLKTNLGKWSKKEILGHLIDSGINNLQRFTEIQFEEKPYKLKSYKQSQLVKANNYQNAEIDEIINLLIAINKRIIEVIMLQTNETLDYEIVTYDNEKFDLRYLIEDYVKHFEHHTNQIID